MRPAYFLTDDSTQLHPGNRVQPLIDGEPAFERISSLIDSAASSVWVTITFLWSDFRMPGGRTALAVFEQAAKRGVDVRLLIWCPEEERHRTNSFWGSEEHHRQLRDDYPSLKVRWDRAAEGYCQHQKSWLIDSVESNGTAIVGGINLNPNSVVPRGHAPRPHTTLQNHDVYAELQGPAVAGVHRNFVQRWRGASEKNRTLGEFGKDLASITTESPAQDTAGDANVSVQRTMAAGLYDDVREQGEKTILEQYLHAIQRAERTIYIENQYLEESKIVRALDAAINRGVEVLVVLPLVPDYTESLIRVSEGRRRFLDTRAALGQHENFTLCGLAADDGSGTRTHVYVHSKLMVVDGAFATVGSGNLHHFSLHGNGEMNFAIEDVTAARALLDDLFSEHVGADVSALDDLAAVRLFKDTAIANRTRHESGESRWQGLAITLDIAGYGSADPL